MKAASVAVPTVQMAAVFTPARILTEASGSSIRASRRQPVSPSTSAISSSWRSSVDSPVAVPRTIGSSA